MVLVIQKCAQAPLNMLIFSKNGWFQHVSTRDHDWVIGVIYTGLLYLFSGFNSAGIVKQFKVGPHSQLGKRDHKGLGNSKNYKNPGLSLNQSQQQNLESSIPGNSIGFCDFRCVPVFFSGTCWVCELPPLSYQHSWCASRYKLVDDMCSGSCSNKDGSSYLCELLYLIAPHIHTLQPGRVPL